MSARAVMPAHVLERLFLLRLTHEGLPEPTPELRFAPPRRWRFDWCWEHHHVALEIEGGAFIAGGGRHNRGAGFMKDLEKYSEAAALGWRILRIAPNQLASDYTIDLIRRALSR